MSNGISLAQARIQLNMPFASEAEVLAAAQAQNIAIIDFSGNNTSQNVNLGANEAVWFAQEAPAAESDTYNGMLSLGNTNQTAQAQTALGANQSQETLDQKLAKFFGRLYTDADPAKKQELVKQYISNILKDKNNPAALEDLKRLVANTPAESDIAQAVLEAVQASGNEELKAALPENFANNVQAANSTGNKGQAADAAQGQRVLREEIDHFESANGWTTIYKKDGSVVKRRAIKGEEGYVRVGSGDDVDAKIRKWFGMSADEVANLSEEEKIEKLRAYVKGVRKVNGGRTALNDFRQLVINTGMSPEEARKLGVAVFSLSDDVINQEIQHICDGSLYRDGEEAFVTSAIRNSDLASHNADLQISMGAELLDIAERDGFSASASDAFSYAAVNGNGANSEVTSQFVQNSYSADAKRANDNFERYKNDPEITANMSDETAAGIADGSAKAACDENVSTEERQRAAGISAAYPQFIDNAQFQMDTLKQNQEYISENGSEEVNDAYVNGMAENAYNYDLSNRDDIIRMVQELGNEKTLEILENARKEYEAQAAEDKAISDAQKASKQATSQQTGNNTKAEETVADNRSRATTSSSTTNAARNTAATSADIKAMIRSDGVSRAISSQSFKNFDVQSKTEFLNSLDQSKRKEAIQSLVENAQGFELDGLMFSGLKNDILKYLVAHPTPQNTEKLQYLQRYLSPEDKKMVEELKVEREERFGQVHVNHGQEETAEANPSGSIQKQTQAIHLNSDL